MKYVLNLTGKNSNEIYTISLPKNLINFIRYDFTVFMERSVDLCKLYMKTGDYRQEEVMEIRNSIIGCHKYYEHNVRTVFDKIVIDCWIEFICRQGEIGLLTLWNNFIPCRNDFERAVFARLNEYRHNHAINQWVNILRIQEYALRKVDFIFSRKVKNIAEAAAKSAYFDLMFNVTANEMGYDITGISENTVSSSGRTPNSPFTMSNVSREIIRNLLSDMAYPEEPKTHSKQNVYLSDQIAMDAFSGMKSFLPTEPDSIINTMIKSMGETQKIYIPPSFKPVIDLEIDALIEYGGVMQKCARCGEYFLRNENYLHDYCDRISRDGRTCLESVNIKEAPVSGKPLELTVDTTVLSARCDQLYREMSDRLNVNMTQRDFSDWYKYLITIRDNVLNGEATMDDFESFVDYSRSISFATPKPKEEPQPVQQEPVSVQLDNYGREVKPFVFEKIDRSQLDEQDNLLYELPKEAPMKRKSSSAEAPVQTRVIRVPNPTEGEKIVPNRTPEEPPATVQRYEELDFAKPGFEQSDMAMLFNKVPKPDTPGDVLHSDVFRDEKPDNDVKIYSYEPPVKVFNPKEKQKKRRPEEAKPVRSTIIEPTSAPKTSAPAVQKTAPPPIRIRDNTERGEHTQRKPGVLHNTAVLEPPKVMPESPPPPVPDNRTRHIVSSYKNAVVSESNEGERIEEKAAVVTEASNIERPKSIRLENVPEIGFTDILKGLERNDGFETVETASIEESPVSHKTKRVMDAIFKPAKPSMSINIKNNETKQ